MCLHAFAGSLYLSTLCDVFTLLRCQAGNGVYVILLTWVFNTRAIFKQTHFNMYINIGANKKKKKHFLADLKTHKISPSKSIPEATHSNTLRKDSPTPIGLSDVLMAFSTSSSRGYNGKREQI